MKYVYDNNIKKYKKKLNSLFLNLIHVKSSWSQYVINYAAKMLTLEISKFLDKSAIHIFYAEENIRV